MKIQSKWPHADLVLEKKFSSRSKVLDFILHKLLAFLKTEIDF